MKKIILLGLLMTNFVQATNGVFAINDVCAALGCFPGDAAGYPVTITNSGSYQLTGTIVSTSTSVNVIEINANNVTLDLNGFSIIGPRGCSGFNDTLSCSDVGMTADGITTSAVDRFNLVVKNGIVKGFDLGIRLQGRNLTVNNITAEENSFGITLTGNGLINDCITNRNISTGISGILSTILVNNSMAMGNKAGPVFIGAGVCSNVLFNLNGNASSFCAKYTNGSICEGLVACL